MKPYIIEHPLRTISLMVTDEAPVALETEALKLYVELHDKVIELKQHWNHCRDQLIRIQFMARNIKKQFEILYNEALRYGPIGGFEYEEFEHVLDENNITSFNSDDLVRAARTYSSMVKPYNRVNEEMIQLDNEGQAMDEQMDADFGYFHDNYHMVMLRREGPFYLDPVSLDDDLDKLREAWHQVSLMRDSFIDDWNELSADIGKTDDALKELNPHLGQIAHAFNPPLSWDDEEPAKEVQENDLPVVSFTVDKPSNPELENQ